MLGVQFSRGSGRSALGEFRPASKTPGRAPARYSEPRAGGRARGERDRAGLGESARAGRRSGRAEGAAVLRRRSPRRASSSCRMLSAPLFRSSSFAADGAATEERSASKSAGRPYQARPILIALSLPASTKRRVCRASKGDTTRGGPWGALAFAIARRKPAMAFIMSFAASRTAASISRGSAGSTPRVVTPRFVAAFMNSAAP